MEKAPNYDHELVVPIDRNGGSETIRIKDIPYSVYKAARPHFSENPDKAIMIILSSVTIQEDKPKLKIFEGDNLIVMRSVEDLISQLITPVQGEIKKNSSSTK